jgi:beta-glucosidase
LRAYRFSIAWPRVLPSGTGSVNTAGLDFYSRLVDALLEAGIEPWPTLYHWDLPQALQERGGFTNRQVADWFADYATVVVRALGDRVKRWFTLNEPQVFSLLGHLAGEHAPAVQAIRAASSDARVGPVHQAPPVHPLTDGDVDREGARRWDAFFNRLFLDPMHLGRYPDEVLPDLLPAALPLQPGDLELIHQPVDFVGMNNYTRFFARGVPEAGGLGAFPVLDHRVPGAAYTEMGWEIYPDGLYEVLMRLKHEYGAPEIHVTENGGAFPDVLRDGAVDDADRIALLRGYLGAVARARRDGADVRGYFVWSLLDNFEWAHGYHKRFGLVHVDYATQTRTPKASARWYRALIARGGLD